MKFHDAAFQLEKTIVKIFVFGLTLGAIVAATGVFLFFQVVR